MKYTYEELAGMSDHSLLLPTLTDQDASATAAILDAYPGAKK